METKKCTKCKEEKEVCEFNKDKARKDGFKNFCKKCRNIQRNEWVKNNKEKNNATRKEYNEKNKERIALVKQKYNTRPNVIYKTKEYREKNKEKINNRRRELKKIKKELNKPILKKGEKQCTKCKIIKVVEKFNKNKNSKDGYYSSCKECKKQLDKIYNEKNKENRKLSSKKWVEDNKEKIKIYKRKWKKDKIYTNPLFKLQESIRSSISASFRNRGYKKKSSTAEILGCSFEFFKKYIEDRFEKWMDWENKGLYNGEFNNGWDLDHIIPISSAKTEEDIIRLNHYTNLQPLCSKVNREIKRNIIF